MQGRIVLLIILVFAAFTGIGYYFGDRNVEKQYYNTNVEEIINQRDSIWLKNQHLQIENLMLKDELISRRKNEKYRKREEEALKADEEF